MEHSPYGLRVTLPVPFDTAVADATAALKAEGFGVLTTIDVQQTLKKIMVQKLVQRTFQDPGAATDLPDDAEV